jgi:hypothetical protein
MSWVQVDGSIKDDKLKSSTDTGSAYFLRGTIAIQDAMRQMDDGKPQDGLKIGIEAAGNFNQAQIRFREAADRLLSDKTVSKEMTTYIRRVDFRQKAEVLKLQEPDSDPIWNFALSSLTDDKPRVFNVAADLAKDLGERSSRFFSDLAANKHSATSGAALLAHVGRALTFGAYVSGIFAK